MGEGDGINAFRGAGKGWRSGSRPARLAVVAGTDLDRSKAKPIGDCQIGSREEDWLMHISRPWSGMSSGDGLCSHPRAST